MSGGCEVRNVEKQKVPELRFKQEDGTEFPAWQKKKLSDLVSRITRKNVGNQTTIPLTISSQDGLVNQYDFFTKQIASKDMSGYFFLKRGEFAYNKSSSQGYDYGSIKRLDLYDTGALSTLYICFGLKDGVDSDFMATYFDSLKWYRDIYMISTEGARNHGLLNVAPADFFATTHFVPSDIEQQKIGEFFTKLNRSLSLADKKLATLQTIKKGMLQKIFSQELRFKDDEGKEFPVWKEHIIEEFYKNISSGKSSKSDTGSYPLYGSMGIIGHSDTTDYIGDKILIARVGAHAGDLNFVHQDCGVTDNTLIIQDSNENIDLKWLYYCLVAVNLNKLTFGTGQPLITGKMLKKLQIEVPDKTEQQKIAAYFTALDRAIAAAQQKAAALRTIKRGLLQKMFV